MEKPAKRTLLKVPEDTIIDDLSLHDHLYTESVLAKNIDRLFRKTLLNTQTLSEEFCAKYIYSMEIWGINECEEMDMNDILLKQPHLDKTRLEEAIHKIWYQE